MSIYNKIFNLNMYLQKIFNLHIYHIYPTPPLEQDMTQGQFLSGV